jgi:hypothetical protein
MDVLRNHPNGTSSLVTGAKVMISTNRKKIKMTPLKAIKAFCQHICMADDPENPVRGCTSGFERQGLGPCPLFPFRLGTNPKRKGCGGNPNFGRKTT